MTQPTRLCALISARYINLTPFLSRRPAAPAHPPSQEVRRVGDPTFHAARGPTFFELARSRPAAYVAELLGFEDLAQPT